MLALMIIVISTISPPDVMTDVVPMEQCKWMKQQYEKPGVKIYCRPVQEYSIH